MSPEREGVGEEAAESGGEGTALAALEGEAAEEALEGLSENAVTDGRGKRRRAWSGTRLVALLAIIAVASLLVGVGVMQFIVSPAELAARTAAPEPGPVTAAIEERVIENTVVTRGEITYADAVEVEIDSGSSENRPVITGAVPEIGAVLKPLDIALEVAGRPVIVLPGTLPAYRTLSIGMRGPDVLQLKTALQSLGFGAGDTGNDTFEWDTAAAVGAMYEQLGYEAEAGDPEAQTALRDAERGVRDAETGLAQAQATLAEAVADGARNVIAEQAAVDSAYEAISDAQETLTTAQEAALPTLPASEVLYLDELPRRVDDVSVERGEVLSGSPMSVSGATLTIVGTVSKQDAQLLTDGLTAYFPGPDGEDLTAEVAKISAPKKGKSGGGDDASEDGDGSDGESGESAGGGSRYTVQLTPGELSSDQIEMLRGTNVRVTIPVASTEGKVLAVPIAALSAGSDGSDRVELLIDVKNGADAETENIPVEAGLAADGYVEIASENRRIKSGAKVVVGR
ncbi:MAG: hypothetical protein ACK5LO_12895 [Leucobacter sp.]